MATSKLQLSDSVRRDLVPLQSFTDEHAELYTSLISEALHSTLTKKQINNASHGFGLESDVLAPCLDATIFVLVESSRLQVRSEDLSETFTTDLNLQTAPLVAGLLQLYTEKKDRLRVLLENSSIQPLHYSDLSWRLDVQLASRFTQQMVNPLYMIQLDLSNSSIKAAGDALDDSRSVVSHSVDQKQEQTSKSIVLQATYTDLKHVCAELEAALAGSKAQHTRRIMRYIR